LDFPLADALCYAFGQKDMMDLTQEKHHWSNLIPLYLRASEAEENLKGIKFLPL
jgi:hypothetical protein